MLLAYLERRAWLLPHLVLWAGGPWLCFTRSDHSQGLPTDQMHHSHLGLHGQLLLVDAWPDIGSPRLLYSRLWAGPQPVERGIGGGSQHIVLVTTSPSDCCQTDACLGGAFARLLGQHLRCEIMVRCQVFLAAPGEDFSASCVAGTWSKSGSTQIARRIEPLHTVVCQLAKGVTRASTNKSLAPVGEGLRKAGTPLLAKGKGQKAKGPGPPHAPLPEPLGGPQPLLALVIVDSVPAALLPLLTQYLASGTPVVVVDTVVPTRLHAPCASAQFLHQHHVPRLALGVIQRSPGPMPIAPDLGARLGPCNQTGLRFLDLYLRAVRQWGGMDVEPPPDLPSLQLLREMSAADSGPPLDTSFPSELLAAAQTLPLQGIATLGLRYAGGLAALAAALQQPTIVIAAAGGSVTAGHGTKGPPFPAQLEALLQRPLSTRRIQVWNGGRPADTVFCAGGRHSVQRLHCHH